MREAKGGRGRRGLALLLALGLALGVAGCTVAVPEGIAPVTPFEIERYLGRWYEIARLDHPFERGLTNVSADYSLRPDGGLRVLNRGYAPAEGRWKSAEGRGSFAGRPGEGFLKVSFFGPFYGSYVVFELDPEYGHALVCGPDRRYLWLLARTPRIDAALEARLLARAAALGFDTAALIRVPHDRP